MEGRLVAERLGTLADAAVARAAGCQPGRPGTDPTSGEEETRAGPAQGSGWGDQLRARLDRLPLRSGLGPCVAG